MVFSLQKKSIKYFLLTVRLSYLYLAALSFLVLISTFWFYCCYLPLEKSIEHNHQLNNQLYKQQTTMVRLQQAKPKLQESVAQLQQTISGYSNKQPATQSLHDAVLFLTESAQAQKLELRTCRLCNAHDKKWCKTNQITCEFFGSLNQIISFFESLKNSKRLIKCKKFELTKQANAGYSCACVFQLLSVV